MIMMIMDHRNICWTGSHIQQTKRSSSNQTKSTFFTIKIFVINIFFSKQSNSIYILCNVACMLHLLKKYQLCEHDDGWAELRNCDIEWEVYYINPLQFFNILYYYYARKSVDVNFCLLNFINFNYILVVFFRILLQFINAKKKFVSCQTTMSMMINDHSVQLH